MRWRRRTTRTPFAEVAKAARHGVAQGDPIVSVFDVGPELGGSSVPEARDGGR